MGKRTGRKVRLPMGPADRKEPGGGIRRTLLRSLAMIPLGTLLVWLALSCDHSYTPKPSGYVRIDFPERTYRMYDAQPFYRFEIPTYIHVEQDSSPGADPGWINLVVPSLNGTIHLSYKPVHGNLGDYITDSRTLAYKHTVKAEGIEETPFIEREQKRYGMIYDLKGDVASAVQFYLTDSTHHFLRGSLYFNAPPNRDSLNPVIDYLREDIVHLIESTQWKY
jgi:gliding motility-associated lipoprotein GldD